MDIWYIGLRRNFHPGNRKIHSRITTDASLIDRQLISQALSQIPKGSVTRFAPSPTGYLHLGHVFSAVVTYGIAHAVQGKCLTRIEDHDWGRRRAEYETAIIEDLQWLGFIDENEDILIQSSHKDRYAKIFQDFEEKGLLFPCSCTRKAMEQKMGTRQPGQELHHPFPCIIQHNPDQNAGWRLLVPDEKFTFHDLFLGVQQQNPFHQCGDILIRDRSGYWTYQWSVAIDDWVEGVELVIRGEDLLSSTARQILLGRLLGRKTPIQFLHHPLLNDDSGKKLSKRFLSTSIRELKESGASAEDVLGRACFLGGIVPQETSLSMSKVLELFHV